MPSTVLEQLWRVVGASHCNPALQVSLPGVQIWRALLRVLWLPLPPCLPPRRRRAALSSCPRTATEPSPTAAAARKRSAPRRLWVAASSLVSASNRVVSIVVSFSPLLAGSGASRSDAFRLGLSRGADRRGGHDAGVSWHTGRGQGGIQGRDPDTNDAAAGGARV